MLRKFFIMWRTILIVTILSIFEFAISDLVNIDWNFEESKCAPGFYFSTVGHFNIT